MSRFKEPHFQLTFKLVKENICCTKRKHDGISMERCLTRFDTIIYFKDCSDCIRLMEKKINRCRSKRQLHLLLTKLEKEYRDGNSRKIEGAES